MSAVVTAQSLGVQLSWSPLPGLAPYIYNIQYRPSIPQQAIDATAQLLRTTVFADEGWPDTYAKLQSQRALDPLEQWRLWDVPLPRDNFSKRSVRMHASRNPVEHFTACVFIRAHQLTTCWPPAMSSILISSLSPIYNVCRFKSVGWSGTPSMTSAWLHMLGQPSWPATL